MLRPAAFLVGTVLISEAVRNDLADQTPWQDHGEWSLKGKSAKMKLFGLPAAAVEKAAAKQ